MPAVSPQDEGDLAVRLKQGDPNAGAEVFHAYFNRLYSLVYYCVDRDHSTAEDITQETFLSALKSAKKYSGRSSIYTWLVGIANHKIADYYRRLESERKYLNQTILTPPAGQEDTSDGFERMLSGPALSLPGGTAFKILRGHAGYRNQQDDEPYPEIGRRAFEPGAGGFKKLRKR